MQLNNETYKFKAYAKLNLGLKVVGKKDNGYHLLKTIFTLIDLYDNIEISLNKSSNEIKFINHNYPWPETNDLGYKAACALQQRTRINLGANIQIKKNIPHGGGMGGGSSDAATVIVALNEIWKTNLTKAELIEIGANIGADIPFFIFGKNAYAEGIGEILSEINLEKKYFIVITPDIHIATKDIFNKLTLDKNKTINIDKDYLLKTLENDLEPIARNSYPYLEEIFKDLKQYGKPVMTGSGSSIYLMYNNLYDAKKVAEKVKGKYNHYLVSSL